MSTTVALSFLRSMLANRSSSKHEAPLAPDDFAPRLRTRILVLQPTPFCNINCSYCYLPSRHVSKLMTIDVVRAATRRLVQDRLLGDDISVVWHAGEPLVAPISFYRKAFRALADEFAGTTRIEYSLQTNATLIDDAWCELFKAFDIEVGVSIDGPESIHDACRKTRSGKGTYAGVMRGIESLKKHDIPFHVIAVVTAHSIGEPDRLFDFFSNLGASELCLNFEEAEGANLASSLSGLESEHQQFIDRLFHRNDGSKKTMRLREFDRALNAIGRERSTARYRSSVYIDNVQALPFAITSVASNGDFSTFSPELLGQSNGRYSGFVLGNVERDSYLESTSREPFLSMFRDILAGLDRCKSSCEYYRYCGGGAPANKLFENGTFDSAETLYCRTGFKQPFDAVLRHLEKTV